MRDLLVLQNKAAKVILDLSNYASSTNALKHSDGLPYFKTALYIDTLPLLSTSTDLYITILIFWETLTSIVITLEEGTISVFSRQKELRKAETFFIKALRNGVF